MNIAFFGSSDFTLPLLQSIYDSEHALTLIVTQPDTQLRNNTNQNSIAEFAQKNNITCLKPNNIKKEYQKHKMQHNNNNNNNMHKQNTI